MLIGCFAIQVVLNQLAGGTHVSLPWLRAVFRSRAGRCQTGVSGDVYSRKTGCSGRPDDGGKGDHQ